jgi:KDO2-lipid IV(A) lauroyltransferase
MVTEADKRPPLTPGFWPGWLAVGFLWLVGKSPQWFGNCLSRPLGWLMSRLMKSRHRVAERNIERCFPDLDADARRNLVASCFRSLGRMLFEVAWSWSGSERRTARMSLVHGVENLESAVATGRGVLVVTCHMTCLEFGGRIFGRQSPDCRFIYRPLKSPVIEWYQNRSRRKYSDRGIPKKDMRSAIRCLKQGGVLWYAPDQDFGPRQSRFAPFFGIQTATLEATVRLAQLTGCTVLTMLPSYDDKTRRYSITISPVLDNFPGQDLEADLARVNLILEKHIRRYPDQYWWIHRRFKTRPEGEAPFYD